MVDVNVPAIEKLIEVAASGIGSVAGPLLAPWIAERQGQARIEAAKADKEVANLHTEAAIEAHRRMSQEGILALPDIASEVIQFQYERRSRNVASVMQQAAEQLRDKKAPNKEPDHDWTSRFFDFVQDVSSEELQVLWAKVLSEEVVCSGSTSLHTLSILRNLDKNVARTFEKLCSICVSFHVGDGGAIALSLGDDAGQNALQPYGLNFKTLNVLHEHGFITPSYNISRPFELHAGKSATEIEAIWLPFEYQRRCWILVNPHKTPSGDDLRFEGVALTNPGCELMKVVTVRPNKEYTEALHRFLGTKSLSLLEVGSLDVLVRDVTSPDASFRKIPTS